MKWHVDLHRFSPSLTDLFNCRYSKRGAKSVHNCLDGCRTCRQLPAHVGGCAIRIALTLCLFCMGGFASNGPRGAVKGTVRNSSGIPITHAKVVARPTNGQGFSSTFTDNKGKFQFPALPTGTWLLEVYCHNCTTALKHSVVVGSGHTIEVNIVLESAKQTHLERGKSIGAVSFYNKPEFQSGSLEDPSAGGGYSDSASVQSRTMLKQYLLSSKSTQDTKRRAVSKGSPEEVEASETSLENAASKLLAQKDFQGAAALFKKGVSRYPDSARLQMGLGVSLYQTGKYNAAIQALTCAARLSPDNPSPLVMLAEASQYTIPAEPASESVLEHFVDLHPQSERGHYAYGLYLWSQLRTKHDRKVLALAQSQLEKAVAIRPDNADAHLHLGLIYDYEKATKQAIEEFREAIRTNPRLAAPHYRLALDYRRVGEQAKAIHEMTVYEKLQKANSR